MHAISIQRIIQVEKKNKPSEPFLFSLVKNFLPESDNEPDDPGTMSNRAFYLIIFIIALTIGFYFIFSKSF